MLFWPDDRYLTAAQVGALGPATGDRWAYVGSYWFNWRGEDEFDEKPPAVGGVDGRDLATADRTADPGGVEAHQSRIVAPPGVVVEG
jgi:predicted chitinase